MSSSSQPQATAVSGRQPVGNSTTAEGSLHTLTSKTEDTAVNARAELRRNCGENAPLGNGRLST